MKILLKIIPFVMLLFLMACSDRELPVTPELSDDVSIEPHIVPEFMNPDSVYTVSVSVTSEQQLDYVRLQLIVGNDTLNTVNMYDDGAQVDATDGDVVAWDGVFTQSVHWTFAEEEVLTVNLLCTGILGNAKTGDATTFNAQHIYNIAPGIVSLSVPDTLKSGFSEPLAFLAEVQDVNGADDIKAVTFKGYQNNQVLFEGQLQPRAREGSYVLEIDSTFAVGKSGLYTLEFIVTDNSDANSEPVSKSIYIENKKSTMIELIAPSVMDQPLQGNVYQLIQLTVQDPQGNDDIKEVMMSWEKPDGSFAGGSPYQLFDNGLGFDPNLVGWDQGYRGDRIADDGIYSITIVFDDDDLLGDYILTFWVEDLVGNKSEEQLHVITLQ